MTDWMKVFGWSFLFLFAVFATIMQIIERDAMNFMIGLFFSAWWLTLLLKSLFSKVTRDGD